MSTAVPTSPVSAAPASAPGPSITADAFLAEPSTPRWIKDVYRFLPVKSQFVLSTNVRDRYAFPIDEGQCVPLALTPYLAESLALRGYERFIQYDPIDGFTVVAPRGHSEQESRDFFRDRFKINFDPRGRMLCSLERSLEIMTEMIQHRDTFIAIFADLASRYTVRLESLTEKEHAYFTRALKLSHSAQPHTTATVREAQFNPLFWICDRENDLPSWLTLDNPRLRAVVVPKPDHILRRAMVRALAPSLPGHLQASEAEQATIGEIFVEQTEGMVLTDVIAITQLCRREGLAFREIGEAVRRYKLGVTEDPWRRLDRAKIANGREVIARRVKGQTPAVIKALDIIKRAVTGLSGSQGSQLGGRPRGVMFLAGPTGVGKTELAKALTELLFGDESAYIRFDMSEFAAEHADQRLLGAPPGYAGFDSGGELTNAVREKPFSVVLFDEIEKAHPRILDKFLQMLDGGVLTSGRGERVYFSETVIVFTSNLGITKFSPEGIRIPNVQSTDPYEVVEAKVREEISDYFKTQINRPEILNRIGENIVVFDFIRPDVASMIFDKMVANILARLAERRSMAVTLSDEARKTLHEVCLRDLSHGGRGIGNQLEAWLINPLARALFDATVPEGSSIVVQEVGTVEDVPTVVLSGATPF